MAHNQARIDGSRADQRGPRGQGLRILIENSEYWLSNNGDLAMMSVTVRRLRERWPEARIAVLTDSPSLLRAYFPDVEAITVHDSDPWDADSPIEMLASRIGPRLVGPIALTRLRYTILVQQKAKGAVGRMRRAWRALAGNPDPVPSRGPITAVTRGSFGALETASLLVVLGGGYLTDADPAQTKRVLTLIERACDLDVPVAMVGQGLGPIDQPELRSRAAAVLPRVSSIALRENRRGPALLDEIGVSPGSVSITGDDAIELAYAQRQEALGHDIGVCLRVADYSPVSADARETVGRVVRSSAADVGARLAPLVIAEYKAQDRRSTLPLVRGYPDLRRPPGRYTRPERIAARVAECRVVVTGAYHLAVFALSQGIPVVGLTSSAYYDDKFLGLDGMFETGLELVDLRDPELEHVLAAAIGSAWQRAAQVRDPLRARARQQITDSKEGYDRVFRLVDAARSHR